MHQGEFEIVVLRPTTVFLSFLASQLSEKNIPSVKQIQTDNTAYVIKKKHSDEETLQEIEKHFTAMFRHEICRWLGPDASNDIETSFIDFLCCFKFELHSHIVLMEQSMYEGRQMLNIKPQTKLLQWMQSSIEEDDGVNEVMEHITLSQVTENSTVIVKNFQNIKDIKTFIKHYYKPIFETAMSRMCGQKALWPAMNAYPAFLHYFAIEIHTQLVHLHY